MSEVFVVNSLTKYLFWFSIVIKAAIFNILSVELKFNAFVCIIACYHLMDKNGEIGDSNCHQFLRQAK